MYRLQLMILMSFVGGSALWAQDPESENESSEEPAAEESAEPENTVSDEEIDELLGLDEDYADIEDDDFNPTEDVRFEQSIPFPADI